MPKQNDDLMPVVEFLSLSRENLEVATVIHEQYAAARGEILKRFFEKLGDRLIQDRPEWDWGYSLEFFVDRYGAFWVAKESWRGEYEVRIEASDWGNELVGGVWRNVSILNGREIDRAILTEFELQIPSAQAAQWYEAYVPITSPVPDWRQPEALWRMQSDDRFLEDVASQFNLWIEIAEQHVDAVVTQSAPAGTQ